MRKNKRVDSLEDGKMYWLFFSKEIEPILEESEEIVKIGIERMKPLQMRE